MLYKQSKERWFEKQCEKLFENKLARKLIEECVVIRDPNVDAYKIENYPHEYNSWMVFRLVVNIILGADLVTWCVFTYLHWVVPESIGFMDVLLYVTGLTMSAFALWSKADAHRVLGEYAWYWGDFFFLLDSDELIFDGIFQMFPHPMYTVGYCFYYGSAMVTHSYTVLYVSVWAHVCQMIFLVFIENPHIAKTYQTISEPTEEEKKRDQILYNEVDGFFESKDKKDAIYVFNLKFLRVADLFTVLIYGYVLLLALLPLSSGFYFLQAIFWRVIHCLLFISLYYQSREHSWTKMYESYGWSKRDAFDAWKSVYNLVLGCMHMSFWVLAYNCFQFKSPDVDWGLYSLQISAGIALISLNIYTAFETYEVLGSFGYFYGDFFAKDIPAKLEYHGIYRYMNNPEMVIGTTQYYGLALITNSIPILVFAVCHHLYIAIAITVVERPHMEQTYGAAIRPDGGITMEVKKKIREGAEVAKDLPNKTKRRLKLIEDTIGQFVRRPSSGLPSPSKRDGKAD